MNEKKQEKKEDPLNASLIAEDPNPNINILLSKYKLNYVFHPTKDDKDRCFARFFLPKESIPISIDLRPLWGEIFDQGELGSCTSNSIAGHVRYILFKSRGPSLHPSRLFIYYNGRVVAGEPFNEDTGLSIKDGCVSVNKYGVCDEAMWPYNINKFATRPSDMCYSEAAKNNQFSYFNVPQTLDQIRQCLSQKYLISFGARLFESFMSSATARSGMVQMPSSDEVEIGSHAMCIVGYNDRTRLFAVANSWSDRWGRNGFCFIPYDYICNKNYCGDFWTLRYHVEF